MASVNQITKVIKSGASGPPAAPDAAASPPNKTSFVNLLHAAHETRRHELREERSR